MNDWNKNTGNEGEEMAAGWLVKKGFAIVERNWRFKHWEVDIIASNGRKLHFVEVKTRSNHRFGKPEESIKRDKMTAMKNVAEEYLYQHAEWQYIQFDIVAITLEGENPLEILLIEDVYF